MAKFKFYDGSSWVELAKKSDIPSLSGYATQTWVENKGYITSSGSCAYATSAGSAPASDVYAWAKASTKPSYSASEVGAIATSGGAITGIITRDAGGSWISARDNCVIKTTRTSSSGSDWHPVIGIKTSDGFWSFGSVGGETLCLSYDTDSNYNQSNNESAVIYFPTAGRSGTIALTSDIPTNTNQLTNGAGFITSSGSCSYASSAGAVAWANVSGHPTALSQFTNDSGFITGINSTMVVSALGYTPGTSNFSGNYNDLSNKPTIPTNNNQLTNGAGYITSSALNGYATQTWVQNQGYVTTDHTYNFAGTTFNSGNSGTAEHNCNDAVDNGVYYYTSNGPSGLGESTTDGALYVQAYSSSWVAQIAQDYRNGRLFVRGKNNGTWQSWKRIANYDEIPSLSGYATEQWVQQQGYGTSNFTGYTSSNKLSTNYIQNDAGWTSNAGTVTSVSAGNGLSISGTASVNPTVNVASGYKLPTTTEWSDLRQVPTVGANDTGKFLMAGISGNAPTWSTPTAAIYRHDVYLYYASGDVRIYVSFYSQTSSYSTAADVLQALFGRTYNKTYYGLFTVSYDDGYDFSLSAITSVTKSGSNLTFNMRGVGFYACTIIDTYGTTSGTGDLPLETINVDNTTLVSDTATLI